MRKFNFIVFLICVITTCLPSSAENFFKRGMMWVYQIDNPQIEYTYTVRYYVDNAVISDNSEEVLHLIYINDDVDSLPKVVCNIKTEGEKVFFSSLDAPEEWMLMYDFDIDAGSEVEVYNSFMVGGTQFEPKQFSLKCTEVGATAEGLKTFKMLDLRDGSIFDPTSYGTWIDGIGSTNDILNNCRYYLDGIMSYLIYAELDDKLIYQNPNWAGIPSVDKKTNLRHSVSGNVLNISNLKPKEAVSLYSSDGKLIANTTADADGKVSAPISKGTYIIKRTGESLKLVF